MDLRQTCTHKKQKSYISPENPAQDAPYLHAKGTTCRNLTSDERKHEILRDLLTDQRYQRRGEKNNRETQRLLVWQCAMNLAFIQVPPPPPPQPQLPS